MIKVLLTGSAGQLGQAIIDKKPRNIKLIPTDKKTLNLGVKASCWDAIEKYRPDWVINCGAYTKVDKAENEKDLAYAINKNGPKELSLALKSMGGKLIQLSTDFVFNGNKNKPYKENEKRDPLNIYGASKAEGEKMVENILFKSNQAIILRTSWVMGPVGNNFALTMLRLHKEKETISVVNDQFGSPTSTLNLANVCWKIIENDKNEHIRSGIIHWCDKGITNWYEIALEITRISKDIGIIKNGAKIIPISSSNYPTDAKRPLFSVLDCSKSSKIIKLSQEDWRKSLSEVLNFHRNSNIYSQK